MSALKFGKQTGKAIKGTTFAKASSDEATEKELNPDRRNPARIGVNLTTDQTDLAIL